MKHRHRFGPGLDLGTRPRICAQLQLSPKNGESALLEGVMDFNIDRETPGSVRIALWDEWRSMLEGLQGVGPVWSIIRNGHAVLAVQGDFPRLAFAEDGQAAHFCSGETALHCDLTAWRQAVAFDTACCCGHNVGVEIENFRGEVFQRICLMRGSDVSPFVEWIQTHQATGLELDYAGTPMEEVPFQGRPAGALEVAPGLLRTVLITAAQREIGLVVGVSAPGLTQAARIDVRHASETHGWVVLTGPGRSLYVEAEPTAPVLLEPGSVEGESTWVMSQVSREGGRLLRVQGGVDSRGAWNQLVREVVLCAAG